MSLRSAAILSSALVMITLAPPALAQDDLAAGRAEFQTSCLACHGEQGRGDGPMAELLTIKPSDLTQLSKANAGKFPFLKIFQTIDGRATVRGHGFGPMPLWGERYKAEAGGTAAEPYRSYTAETQIRARLLELTYYIQSLQE